MRYSDEEYIDGIHKRISENLLAELTLYAERGIRRVNFLFGGTISASGDTCEDFVQEAIYRVLDGRRTWDGETDFTVFMKNVIKSLISHDYDSLKAKKTERESARAYFRTDDESDGYSLDDEKGDSPRPSAGVEIEERLWEFIEFVSDDEVLEKIVTCHFDDVTKPADIAKALGKDVSEIYAAQKRLRRRQDEFAQMKKESTHEGK